MSCECYGVITDPERARVFAGIFPGDRIPLRNAMVAGEGEWTRNDKKEVGAFYEAAIERFTPDQKVRVAEAIVKLGFRDVTTEEVLHDMADPKMVIPLKADGVITCWCAHHSRALVGAAMDVDDRLGCPECGDPDCGTCPGCGQQECDCTCDDSEGDEVLPE